MATTLAPAQLVQGPPRTPLQFGLFSHVAPRTGDDGRWQISGVEWETLTCAPAGGRGMDYCDPDDVVGLPKTLTRQDTPEGAATPFTVYGWHNCSPIGTSYERGLQLAEQHLIAREEARVERAIWTGDLGNTPSLRDATKVYDVANGVSVVEGVAFLESWSANQYGSQGVIHMTRGFATQALAKGVVKANGPRLFTVLGTPVVAGAGYDGSGPTGEADPATLHSWAYITPAIFGQRGEILPSSGRPYDLLDRGTNDLHSIAERTHLIGWEDCGVGAILLNLRPGDTTP